MNADHKGLYRNHHFVTGAVVFAQIQPLWVFRLVLKVPWKKPLAFSVLAARLMLLVLLLSGSTTFGGQAPVVPNEVIDNIRARVTNGFTPGIVVGLSNPDGTTYFSCGVRDLDSGEPVNEESVFEIGSITKTFTATMLSQFLLDGSMALAAPVKNYLPDNAQIPARSGMVITLHHLATHRSGLPFMPDNWNPATMRNPYADYTVQQMYDFLSSYQLPRDPGAEFEYSNLGLGLLGYVLALRTGSDYAALVADRITRPLAMSDTGIGLTPRMASHLAKGYRGVVQEPNWDYGPPFAGAAALRSTAADLLRYVAANLGLFSSDLSAAMTNAHAIQSPIIPGLSMGLGWFITTLPGDELVWHDGGTGGYRCYAGFRRGTRTGVVVMANSDFDVADLGAHLLDSNQPLNSLPQPVTVPPDMLRRCVGRFQGNDGNYFDLALSHDHLTATYSTDKGLCFTLYPTAPLSFFATLVEASATFATNSEGLVTGFTWHQGGQSLAFNRIPLPARLSIRRANGETQISFTGDTGVNYVLESTPDLAQWTPIATNTIWATPFADREPVGVRFYRVRRE